MKPPILMDFPESFETERLLIRSPLPGDGHELHAAVRESIDELTPCMPWPKEHRTVDGSEASARRARVAYPTAFGAPAASLPERDGYAGGEQRTARDRLGGANVRDRLLVPYRVHGSRLHYRGGSRHHGLRFRDPRGQTRRDQVRLPQSSQREGRPVRWLFARRHAPKQ